ncbi:Ig-like domain-containing protein [Geomesophilobacter sediminis]|uniref:Big-1 domain-containing protein n=1 Tax=Geomesophilobacter sediminis TaxID=2798584 RepID=A0A8J7JGC2_9BACT|nr:Ig-like domain-containing protein [Geomesophilobacter sediminis]MBJ6725724.1 hypothetical protein [Geomesophilobacter sediminis]
MASRYRLVITLMLALLPVGGCGGSGGDPGGVSDPFAQNQPVSTGNGTVLNYAMSLSAAGSTGGTTVGSNGTVIATATLTDSNGNPVAGQPVQFQEVLLNPADSPSVTIPSPVVTTTSEGKAIALLTANSTTVRKDVILRASTSIDGQDVNSVRIFTINGTLLNYSMSLNAVGSTGGTTVGANGTVIATATLTDSSGNPVAGQPVQFEEVLPTAADTPSVTIPVPVVTTASDGKAISILTANSTTANKGVILKASTTINGQNVSGISMFTVVRSTGNYVEFITTKEASDPDGSMNPLQIQLTAVDPVLMPHYGILQLVTVDVLDKNGVKRTHVPVTLQVVGVMGNDCAVSLGVPGGTTQTVFTDDTGLGIFSAEIMMSTPPIGASDSCSVVYSATTPDPYAQIATDLFSYGGYVAMITNNKQ